MNKIKPLILMLFVVFAVGAAGAAFAEDDAPGVSGCGAISVDPSSSLEFQQNVCNAAEANTETSCGASGHGTCSSPKLNDTMPEGTHCVCISETVEEAPSEEAVV